jgi:hypothetical protein
MCLGQATELRPPPPQPKIIMKFLIFFIRFIHFVSLHVLHLGRVPHLHHPCYGSAAMS